MWGGKGLKDERSVDMEEEDKGLGEKEEERHIADISSVPDVLVGQSEPTCCKRQFGKFRFIFLFIWCLSIWFCLFVCLFVCFPRNSSTHIPQPATQPHCFLYSP